MKSVWSGKSDVCRLFTLNFTPFCNARMHKRFSEYVRVPFLEHTDALKDAAFRCVAYQALGRFVKWFIA